MIYCVIPEEMADELYDKLATYYADDANVKVIIDRRRGERRALETAEEAAGAPDASDGGSKQRIIRDRRRRGVPGEFPPIDAG